MQQPGLAEDGDDGRFGLQELADLVVVLHRQILAPGGAEGGEAGAVKVGLACAEEFNVLGIGAGPAALDKVNAKGVEPFGNAQLVLDGEADAFALAAIAQGRIVNLDVGFHRRVAAFISGRRLRRPARPERFSALAEGRPTGRPIIVTHSTKPRIVQRE